MASVKLRAIWFNRVADPTDFLALRFVTGFSRSPEKPGEIRRGAGGRVRLFTRAGWAVSWSLSFQAVAPQQKRWLEDHAGELLCVRDDRGHKVFGSYLSVDVEEHRYNHEADVSLTFTELTHSEAV